MIRKYRTFIYAVALAICLNGCAGSINESAGTVPSDSFSDSAEASPEISPGTTLETKEEEATETSIENSTGFQDRQDARPEDETVPADSDNDSISIVMVGDILLHDGINKTCRLEDGSYD